MYYGGPPELGGVCFSKGRTLDSRIQIQCVFAYCFNVRQKFSNIIFIVSEGFTMSSKEFIFFNQMGVADAQLVRSLRLARKIALPLESFTPLLVEWLSALAFFMNAGPEFVLVGAVSVVSTLMGSKTKLCIRNRYSEPCNLFAVCLSEPGVGKSQAFEISLKSPMKMFKESAL